MNAITETKADHASIYAALAAAQAEMGPALKDAVNPAFRSKYADLASVMSACLPALNKHQICVMQPTGEDEKGRYVETILAHVSGQTVCCRVPLIVAKNDMQGYGSAVTYARRYGLMSMAGIAPEDDDGNAAAKAAPKAEKPAPIAPVADALRQAREDAITDSLPEDATPEQRANAFADSLIAEFNACTGDVALNNRWHRDEKALASLEARFPEIYARVGDAYDTRMNDLMEGKNK